MLPLEAIDRLLSAWEERLRRIDDNLLALEADPAYQTAAGPGSRERFDGETKRQVTEALDEIARLFSDLERLRAVIEQANGGRAVLKGMLWGKDEKMAQIEALLLGPSISRGTEPTALERRSLLDSGGRERAVAPEVLLGEMVRRYEAARDALLSVRRAWQGLEPAVERVEGRMAELERRAAELGAGVVGLDGLLGLRAEVGRVRAQTARDPLGAKGDFEARLDPRFRIVEGAVAALGAQRQQAAEAQRRAEVELSALLRARAEAGRLWQQVSSEVELGPGAAALLPEASEVEALAASLQAIRASWQRGGELAAWQRQAEQLRGRVATAQRRGQTLLERGPEVAGRLSARRIQVEALSERGAVPPELRRWADEAAALLEQRPRALGRAAALLDAIERALAAAPRRAEVGPGAA